MYTLNAIHTFHIECKERKCERERETENIKYGFDTRVIWRARPKSVYLSPINIIPRSMNVVHAAAATTATVVVVIVV